MERRGNIWRTKRQGFRVAAVTPNASFGTSKLLLAACSFRSVAGGAILDHAHHHGPGAFGAEASRDTITTMFAHVGGFIPRCACPARGRSRNVTFRQPDYGSRRRFAASSGRAIEGYLHHCRDDLPVNGKRSEGWRMIVSLDGNDLYSVWLIASDYKGQGRPHMLEAASSV